MPTKPNALLNLAWKTPKRRESGTTIELQILALKGLSSGQEVTLLFTDESQQGNTRNLDEFTATLLKTGKDWGFQEIVDARDEKHPARTNLYALTDHVKVLLPGTQIPLVVLLDPVEHAQVLPTLYKLGIRVFCDGKELTSQLIQCPIWGTEAYKWVSTGSRLEYRASQLYEGLQVQDRIPPNDTWIKQEEQRKQKQWAAQEKRLKEYVDEILKDPDTPFLVDMKRVRQYRELSEQLQTLSEQFNGLRSGDPYYSSYEIQLREIRKKLEAIENDHAQFMNINMGIPTAYKEQVRSAKKRKERCAEIDAIANTPFCMIVCCLPLGGLVEGSLQMLKGNYLQGLLTAGLDVFTFGGFAKLQSARRIYKALEKSSNGVRAQIFEARYLRVCMDLGEQRVAALKGLSALATGFNSVGGGFIKAMANLDDLLGEVRDFKKLLTNKALFSKSLAAAKTPGYQKWLTDALNTNQELIVWGGLRQMAQGYMLADTALQTMDLINAGTQIRTRLTTDLKSLESLLAPSHPTEWNWLHTTVLPALDKIDPAFFADKKMGLLYNGSEKGRDIQQEWLDSVSASRQEERRVERGLQAMKSAQDFHRDLKTLEKIWEKREQEFRGFCTKAGVSPDIELSRQQYASRLAELSVLFPQSLEQAVEGFLEHLEGIVKLVLPDTEAHYGSMPRFYVFYSHFELVKSKKKVSVIRQILFENFRSVAMERLDEIFGE